jgi:hypothetical protein
VDHDTHPILGQTEESEGGEEVAHGTSLAGVKGCEMLQDTKVGGTGRDPSPSTLTPVSGIELVAATLGRHEGEAAPEAGGYDSPSR